MAYGNCRLDALQRVGDGWGLVVRGERNRVVVTLAYGSTRWADERAKPWWRRLVG